MNSRTVKISVIIIIAVISSYLGLQYLSASNITTKLQIQMYGIPDTNTILNDKTFDIQFDVEVEGHGYLPVTVESFEAEVYLEDTHIGKIQSSSFQVPASDTILIHPSFIADNTVFTRAKIQHIVDKIVSHQGEVKISLEGTIKPSVSLITLTSPVSIVKYLHLASKAPKLTELSWDKTSCGLGEQAEFQITIENVYRKADLEGTIEVFVLEDNVFGEDFVDSFVLPITLQPLKSTTITNQFTPVSDAWRYVLRAKWNSEELESELVPRLRVFEGSLRLENVYWTVNNQVVTSCQLGDKVTAHVVVGAYNAGVNDFLTIRIKEDIAWASDIDHKVSSPEFFIPKNQKRDLTVEFMAESRSGFTFRGYFIQIDFSSGEWWTMESLYPPRLTVD